MIINGKDIALNIYNKIKEEVNTLEKKPTLGAILVGDNSSSIRYITQKKKWANYTGINFKLVTLDKNVSEEVLLKNISDFNSDENISGYLVQLPLPKHINEKNIIDSILPEKDVDGFHPINQGKILIGDTSGLIPCTPAGIIEIFKSEKIELTGKVITVIGRSNIVGKPVTNLLINAGATVISCNSKTIEAEKYTSQSDIVIVATGQPGLLKENMLKKGSIIIDVGFTVIDGIIHGDALTEEIDKAGHNITPVPGGVGALTVAMLMKNTLKSHKN